MSRTVWQKLSDALQLSENADVECRRRVLRGVAGLALIAAVPVGVGEGYRLLTKREQADFVHRIESGGVIDGQHFLLDRTMILKDLRNVTIRNCTFVCSTKFEGDHILQLVRCNEFLIQYCTFEVNALAHTAIKVEPSPVAIAAPGIARTKLSGAISEA